MLLIFILHEHELFGDIVSNSLYDANLRLEEEVGVEYFRKKTVHHSLGKSMRFSPLFAFTAALFRFRSSQRLYHSQGFYSLLSALVFLSTYLWGRALVS
jgi:hypothetical protein